jgi:L-ribulose-5-phosphate 4-epimerase
MSAFTDLRRRVCDANRELPERGLVLYTFGNVSGIDRERGICAIKPSGVAYENLEPDHMVLVDLDNNVVEGDLNPSSDTHTHTALYRRFPEIGGIVHTHSTYATAWAQAGLPIPCLGTTHADHVPGDIPCTRVMTDDEVRGPFEALTGELIADMFAARSPLATPMVLVAGHGPFTWGETPEKAVYNSAVLEELAKMAYLTATLNPDVRPLSPALLERHFRRKHGPDSYYGQGSETR